MNKPLLKSMIAAYCLTAAPLYAADFDGSRPLICAPVEAIECQANEDCLGGNPDEMGAPSFTRVDFSVRTISGPLRTTKIVSMDKTADQITLHGNELEHAWTMIIDAQGKMTATLAGRNIAFVLFGSCTTF